MKCPHCKAALLPHTGTKDGFFHCNTCGCCFDAKKQPRAGHPVCSPAAAAAEKAAPEPAPEVVTTDDAVPEGQIIGGTTEEPAPDASGDSGENAAADTTPEAKASN